MVRHRTALGAVGQACLRWVAGRGLAVPGRARIFCPLGVRTCPCETLDRRRAGSFFRLRRRLAEAALQYGFCRGHPRARRDSLIVHDVGQHLECGLAVFAGQGADVFRGFICFHGKQSGGLRQAVQLGLACRGELQEGLILGVGTSANGKLDGRYHPDLEPEASIRRYA